MLQKLTQKLYQRLENELEKTVIIESPLQKLRETLNPIQKVLVELRIAVTENGFDDKLSEINFFKFQKPKFYSWLIYVTECYAIENGMELLGKSEQTGYLQQQLHYINRFFRQNEFMYQYYKIGESELDEKYFLRGKFLQVIGFTEIPEIDPAFGTSGDYLFSKFIAYERLQSHIVEQINSLSSGSESERSRTTPQMLKWTGDSINIVELVYGIYESGQVNNGEASITQIMDQFAQVFQINLNTYFKRFSEIKRRKAMSKTRFLEEMAKLVNQRIDDGDAFIPN